MDFSFFLHIIVSLPYIRTGTSNDPCKTLAHSCCKLLALTRYIIAPASLLPLPTFLLLFASSVSDSSRTHPKYLNSETCSKSIPSTQTSHYNPPPLPPNNIGSYPKSSTKKLSKGNSIKTRWCWRNLFISCKFLCKSTNSLCL